MIFKNNSKHNFVDIPTEKYRVYVFPNISVRLDRPLKLSVSENGHRVFTADGISHYIPKGWVHLYWESDKGDPNFVF